ncbi:sensor histidine kinase [Chryseosolibacter indicus]|uniref:histidine kinase n=1 Tax=Chryseosolibacter indicus TaxID=2782351 RepID=A0ABS5VX78_9BACT|nr:two-component regulator propeller domain-containing protein [Chryseosolibacter indicus]MBT1705494.1 hypothetical protein [Chryseosolibacter indicus]
MNWYKKSALVLTYLLLSAQFLFAQSFSFYNYTTLDGLPSNEIYDIYRDRRGFLWFATDNGVVKFDGKEMQTLHVKDGLPDPVIFSFFEDEKQRIWFRSYSGKLSYYEKGKIKIYKYNDKLLKSSSYGGLLSFIYDAKKEELHFSIRHYKGKIDSLGNVSSREIDLQSTIYYSRINNQYLITLSKNNTKFYQNIAINNKSYPISLSDTSNSNLVKCIIEWKGKTYLSTFNDLFEYDGNTVKRVLQGQSGIISLSIDKQDRLWVGRLVGGVECFYSNDFNRSWAPTIFSGLSVTKIVQGTSGDIWGSTLENGIYNIPNVNIQNYNLNISKVKSLTYSKDRIFIGDQKGGLAVYDTKTRKVIKLISMGSTIMSLFRDGKNNLWVSDLNKIYRFDNDLNITKSYENNNATDFFEDTEGLVWACGGLRVNKFDVEGREHRNIVLDMYRSILTKDSSIYLGGRTGLTVLDKALQHKKKIKEFNDYKISDLIQLNDSTILLATIGNGFILFNSKTYNYTQYNSNSKFIADNIHATLIKDSLLWLGTEKGLAVTSIPSLIENKPDFKYLGKKSGLISNTINYIAEGYKSIWAFSTNGFSVIPDSLFNKRTVRPIFYLNEIRINNREITTHNLKDLAHDQNDITISYHCIYYNNENLFLRYRIKENDNWIPTSNRKIELSSMAPNNYILRLEYSIDNINWHQALEPISCTINPPWWQQWYSIVSAIIILSILSYIYFRHQLSIYNQKNKLLKIINDHQQKLIQSEIVTLERERNRIAKELHDGVGTNLTAIKLMVNQLLNNHNDPMTNEVEDQFQIAIREIKDIIYGLTPPTLERYGLFAGLKNYISKLSGNIPINIALKTYGEESNKYELNIIIFRIIQELIANSIKHSQGKEITIHINSFKDIINIIYEDDGVGFSYNPVQHGLGLDNIESRIRSVNGSLKFESGKFGTSYNIDIPLESEPKEGEEPNILL